ncbi:MAG: ribosomal RNA small subunit methyltransferase A [Candidatus Moranbacteria bacterium]|nr:ribosomal RNA small subunit methyltransferase A [Candidatus Moranbacteria bacterium]
MKRTEKTIRAKKSLGQNFLRDESVVQNILEIANVQAEDSVLEIGPGMGALTFALVPCVKKILAIELDHRLAEELQKQNAHREGVSIVEGDILSLDLEKLFVTSGFAEQGYKVIANIPYYITAPILRRLLSLKHQPKTITLMVQNEVADRLVAKPGSMSLLSVMVQYFATAEKKIFVPKEAFDPVPKVESAVVHIIPNRSYDEETEKRFFRLVKIGFAARRKTLCNNLSSGLHLDRLFIETLLARSDLKKDIRAQALSMADWERLLFVYESEYAMTSP